MTLQKLTPEQATDFAVNSPESCLVALAEIILSHKFIAVYNPNVWQAAEIIKKRYCPVITSAENLACESRNLLTKLVNGEYMAPLPKIPKKPLRPGCNFCGGNHEGHHCFIDMD